MVLEIVQWVSPCLPGEQLAGYPLVLEKRFSGLVIGLGKSLVGYSG